MANQDRHTEGRKSPEKPQEKTERPALTGNAQQRGAERWDVIDEASWESFPGSDAPAHWAGRDIPPDERKRESKEREEEGEDETN